MFIQNSFAFIHINGNPLRGRNVIRLTDKQCCKMVTKAVLQICETIFLILQSKWAVETLRGWQNKSFGFQMKVKSLVFSCFTLLQKVDRSFTYQPKINNSIRIIYLLSSWSLCLLCGYISNNSTLFVTHGCTRQMRYF